MDAERGWAAAGEAVAYRTRPIGHLTTLAVALAITLTLPPATRTSA
jgi:hypothetical protein